jgi:capsid protein
MVKRTCDFVVGDRVSVQIKSSSEEFNKVAERWLTRWWTGGIEHRSGERADGSRVGRSGTQVCRLLVRSALVSGGVLVVLTDGGAIQLVEYERLKNPPKGTTNQAIVNGVEYADGGAGPVIRYHVAAWAGSGEYAAFETRPIDARNVLNLANPMDDEVNVTLPEPGLARLIEHFPMLRNFIRDTQIASRMATLFGLVTKTANPQDAGVALPGGTITKYNADGNGETVREIELEPGFTAHLAPGEDITQVDPKHPTAQFGDFVTNNLVMLGAEAGLPLVLWMLDMTKVNFASARSALLLAGRSFDIWREWLVCSFVTPVIRWRLAMAIRRGEIDGVNEIPDDWDSIHAIFPPLPVLDTLNQYQAEAYAVEKGLKTHRDAWSALNRSDYEDGLEEMASERRKREALGILPVSTPGQIDPNIGRGKPESPTTDEDSE